MIYNEPRTLVDFDVFLIMKEQGINEVSKTEKWKIISTLKYLDAYDHHR